jgi:hypothetical protein
MSCAYCLFAPAPGVGFPAGNCPSRAAPGVGFFPHSAVGPPPAPVQGLSSLSITLPASVFVFRNESS